MINITMKKFLYKKESNIHGSWIFTKKDIAKNELLYTVPTSLVFNEPKNKCAFIWNNKRVSDNLILDNINHSCSPNAILDISRNPILIAKRKINAGEEITVDYNQTEIYGEKVQCSCWSKKCRGFFLRIEKKSPRIWILWGIGPESSALFYKRLIELVQLDWVRSNIDYPHILLESIPAPELLNQTNLLMYKAALANLEKSGADFIAIVCNTAYVFLEELSKEVTIPIVSLENELHSFLKKENINHICVFWSKKTIDNLFHFDNIKVEKIAQKDSIELEEIILEYNVWRSNKRSLKELKELFKKYPQWKIIVACTELSTILSGSGFDYIDTSDILLNATLKKWRS